MVMHMYPDTFCGIFGQSPEPVRKGVGVTAPG